MFFFTQCPNATEGKAYAWIRSAGVYRAHKLLGLGSCKM